MFTLYDDTYRRLNMATVRSAAVPVLAAILSAALASCAWDESGISDLEDQAVQEQTAEAMSLEEGGVVYSAEMLADPTLYEDLEDLTPVPEGDTGYRTVSWTVDFPYFDSSTTATLRYRLLDGSGAVQEYFTVDTRTVEAELSYSRDVEALRYSASTDQSVEAVVSGLQTGTVTLDGSAWYARTAESADEVPFQFTMSLEVELGIEALTLGLDDGLGRYALEGGSIVTSIEGAVNARSFTRTVSWTFGEGYEATMHFEGEVITVDIQTGTLEG